MRKEPWGGVLQTFLNDVLKKDIELIESAR
jgi:hypothetical protein